jgi:hypothetical protein
MGRQNGGLNGVHSVRFWWHPDPEAPDNVSQNIRPYIPPLRDENVDDTLRMRNEKFVEIRFRNTVTKRPPYYPRGSTKRETDLGQDLIKAWSDIGMTPKIGQPIKKKSEVEKWKLTAQQIYAKHDLRFPD